MPLYSLIFLVTLSCTLPIKNPPSYQSPEGIILSTEYLSLQLEENKKLQCLKDNEEIFLLLRTIRPDYEDALSQINKKTTEQIIRDCNKACQKKWENDFCLSDLYQKLSKEKIHFTLD